MSEMSKKVVCSKSNYSVSKLIETDDYGNETCLGFKVCAPDGSTCKFSSQAAAEAFIEEKLAEIAKKRRAPAPRMR